MGAFRKGCGIFIVGLFWGMTATLGANTADAPVSFGEVWAYHLAGEAKLFDPSMGITDLASFGASLNSSGELVRVPAVEEVKGFKGRRHLVVEIQDNYALAHMALFPDFAVREALISALVKACQGFDGLQLDFESVSSRDKDHFWSFLKELKGRIGDRVLSVAVPARTSVLDDAYDYRVLNNLVDRAIIMAYDEHWSGSVPGSVASLEWCRRVAAFAQGTLSPEKIVMGAPFYGRAWTDKSLARAYKFSALAKIMDEKVVNQARDNGIPHFEYEELVKVRVFYEDRTSQLARLTQYASLGVRNVAFWRLGQEDPSVWSALVQEERP